MENERGGEGFVLPLLATPPTYSRKDGRKNKGPLIIGGKPFSSQWKQNYTKYPSPIISVGGEN